MSNEFTVILITPFVADRLELNFLNYKTLRKPNQELILLMKNNGIRFLVFALYDVH